MVDAAGPSEHAGPSALVPREDRLGGSGTGGMLERIRSVDWAATELGSLTAWPQSLCTALSMVLGAPLAMLVAWGPEHRVLYNDTCQPLLGDRHPRALGQPLAAAFPALAEQLGEDLARIGRGEAVVADDWSCEVERDGRREARSLWCSCSPIRDESGAVGGLLAVFVDASHRVDRERLREIEAAHRSAEAQRRAVYAMFEQVPAAIAVVRGDDMIYEMANRTYTAVGGGPIDLIGRAALDVFPQLRGRGLEQMVAQVRRTREPCTVHEMEVDGRWWSFVLAALDGEAGADRVLSFSFEVTDLVLARRSAERAITRLEDTVALLDATVAGVPVGLAYYDRDLRIVRVNDLIARWNGFDRDRVIGRPIAEIMPPESAERVTRQVREVFRTGAPCETATLTTPTLAAPDEPRHWLITYHPVLSPAGEVVQVGAVVVDVTEEVRARSELARTVEYNEKFTAMLGHDLRNPLNSIMTAAELLLRRTTSPDIARPASRIVLSAERMSRMIAQLLDLARARLAGGLRLQLAAVDLAAVCQLVIDELRNAYPGAQIQLAAIGGLLGRWDSDRLAQVLSNLAGNAVEHGEHDAPVAIRIDGSDPLRVAIQIANRGAIPPELLASLFEPFRTVSYRGQRTRGLGLGLFISHQIVSAHGGQIAVQSSELDGTRFEISLPRSAGDG